MVKYISVAPNKEAAIRGGLNWSTFKVYPGYEERKFNSRFIYNSNKRSIWTYIE